MNVIYYGISAIFLHHQNGALSVEILYFLTGSVMCHPDVVNIVKNDLEINHSTKQNLEIHP